MAGRGPQTFKKRQKEQARKEKQLEKRAKKLERKLRGPEEETPEDASGELGELGEDALGEDAVGDDLAAGPQAPAGAEGEQRQR
jgi:hypothetical protein